MAQNFKNDLPQMTLLEMPGAVSLGETALPIMPSEVGFEDQDRDDVSMLKEATQNRALAEGFESGRGLISTWNMTEILLRAYVEPVKWKNSDQMRSSLGIPLLAEHFYSILSVVQQSLFAGYRTFMLDPAPGTTVNTAAAHEALISGQLKTCGFKGGPAKNEVRHVVFDGLLYGTGVAMMGWKSAKYDVMKKRPKAPGTIVAVAGGNLTIPGSGEDDIEDYVHHTVEINEPVLEHVPIRRFRIAPDCRRGEAYTASWAGRLIYLSSYDLDQLRDIEGFEIPEREELVRLVTPQKLDTGTTNVLDTQSGSPQSYNPLFVQSTTPQKAYPESYEGSTVDPLAKKWEVFEYWTDHRHVWVLEDQRIIRNVPNELRRIPFLSFVFREAPDSFFGYGLGFWLCDYQRIAQGIVNAFMDDTNLNLMGTYTAPAGMNNSAQAQFIFPGKVFKSDPGGEFKAMTRNAINAQEPLAIIAQLKSWAAQITGAGASTQGYNPGKAGDMRNPEAASIMAGGEATKNQDLIDQICDNIFTPFIKFCIEESQKLKPSQLRQMLADTQLSEAFKGQPLDLINADYSINISAGVKLQARQGLNQIVGFLTSILQAPGTAEMLTVQAMKVDFLSFFNALMDSANYPYRTQIIVPMTDEDKKRVEAQQNQTPQAIAKIQAQGEVKKDVDNNQAENRVLIQTAKHTTDLNKLSVEQEAEQRAERSSLQKGDSSEEGLT